MEKRAKKHGERIPCGRRVKRDEKLHVPIDLNEKGHEAGSGSVIKEDGGGNEEGEAEGGDGMEKG